MRELEYEHLEAIEAVIDRVVLDYGVSLPIATDMFYNSTTYENVVMTHYKHLPNVPHLLSVFNRELKHISLAVVSLTSKFYSITETRISTFNYVEMLEELKKITGYNGTVLMQAVRRYKVYDMVNVDERGLSSSANTAQMVFRGIEARRSNEESSYTTPELGNQRRLSERAKRLLRGRRGLLGRFAPVDVYAQSPRNPSSPPTGVSGQGISASTRASKVLTGRNRKEIGKQSASPVFKGVNIQTRDDISDQIKGEAPSVQRRGRGRGQA